MSVKTFFKRARRLGLDGLYRRIEDLHGQNEALARRLEANSLQLGGVHAARVRSLPDRARLRDTEFKVFSQFGDDGILQYLFSRIPALETFIEFGVEDYSEANTRFLLLHDNWKGLILDGRPDLQAVVDRQGISYLHDLTVRSAFITAENIDELLSSAGFAGEIGLLSVDIDGNDYWVWKAITCVNPQVVVVEYNALFGTKRAVSIPYDPAFTRFKGHFSGMYYGASIPAYCRLAEEKGYAFVGCNQAGNNAYFVRKDLAAPFKVLTAEEGHVMSKLRDTRDREGRMTQLGGKARLEVMADAPLVDLETGKAIRCADLLG